MQVSLALHCYLAVKCVDHDALDLSIQILVTAPHTVPKVQVGRTILLKQDFSLVTGS